MKAQLCIPSLNLNRRTQPASSWSLYWLLCRDRAPIDARTTARGRLSKPRRIENTLDHSRRSEGRAPDDIHLRIQANSVSSPRISPTSTGSVGGEPFEFLLSAPAF